jgi:ABC-type glycerol-3-phosphate transport system substrate-binding protein
MIAAKQFPDVGLIEGPDSVPLVAQGLLRDVRESLDRIAGVNGELFPPFRDLAIAGPFVDRPARQPAPVWAIPHLGLGTAWLIRSDLLVAANQDVPSSFDGARAFAEAATDHSAKRFGWGGALPVSDAADNFVQACLLAEGATLFDGAGYRVDLNPPDAVPGLANLAALYRAEDGSLLAPPDIIGASTDDLAAALAAGRIAQTIDYGGLYARVVGDNPNIATKLRSLPFPSGSKGWFTSATTSTIVVFARRPNSDLAVRFVEALLEPKRFEQVVAAGRGAVVPPYSYLLRAPFWDQDPNYHVYAMGARGDPAQNFQFATLGQPAPLTLPVAVVRGSRLLVKVARSAIGSAQDLLVAAQSLRDQAQSLVGEAYALQPAPTPTPVPDWYHLLELVQRNLK